MTALARNVCLALCLPLLMVLCACARTPDDSSTSLTLTGDFGTPLQLQIDNFVRRQPPAIYVQPGSNLGYRPKALFVPLRMMQQMSEAQTFGRLLSRQVWQIWLSLNAFDTLEFADDAGPYDRRRALALARARGAEFVVGSYINHYLDGGTGGESSMSLLLEIYDVKTGTQLWSLAQAGLMESRQVHDFYLFNIRERNPADPSSFIARSLAWDMGQLVRRWAGPAAQNNKEPSTVDKLLGRQAF